MAKIKIRAKSSKGKTLVKCLMSHPMETGQRKDKAGKKIPAHYISEVSCEHNGAVVMTAHLGPGVSKNPYLAFEINGGAKDDTIKISWADNMGKSAFGEAKVK